METEPITSSLVTPGAMNGCFATWGDLSASILDISFVRLVIGEAEEWPALVETQTIPLELTLNSIRFVAQATVQGRGRGWIRLQFEKWVPSSRSLLKAFLSPKKVGESMLQGKKTDRVYHYHGLNESDLWFDQKGNVLFSYLDYGDPKYQFVIQVGLEKNSVRVGRLTRAQYMNLGSLDQELGLIPLNDRENYIRMTECRDIITNFRPVGQLEYQLKQRLLKMVSESLYSTGHRVEFPMIRTQRAAQLFTENLDTP